MKNLFKININTPEKTILESSVSALTVPGASGFLQVLAHHAPLITTLIAGKISFQDDAGKSTTIYSKGKGFFEFSENKATLLLDSVDKA